MTRTFRAALTKRQTEMNSLVCVGLDPNAEKIPECIRRQHTTEAGAVQHWMIEIVDATAPFASMFKPQLAYWEAVEGGVQALQYVIRHIHKNHPDVMVFADCKRGDIDRTQAKYADAVLGWLDADGMNYNGYMGKSTLSALARPAYAGRALVGLGRTSNPDAWEIQDAVLGNDAFLWELMLEKMLAWSQELGVLADAGVVMGAAHKDPRNSARVVDDHLRLARDIVEGQMWFLIPGIGAQGGFVEATVKATFAGPGSIAINSSSKITEASSGDDFAEAAAREACKLRDAIRSAGGSCA